MNIDIARRAGTVGARFTGVLRAVAGPLLQSDGAIARHLVLGYRPGWQSLDDLNAIAGFVHDQDPTIRTFVVSTAHRNAIIGKSIAAKPTLTVSNGRLIAFRPPRGRVYQGWPIPKIEELRRLQMAGLPVPKTELLTPTLKLDPADWGEFVIVKPTDIATSSQGRGVHLMRTARVRFIPPLDYPRGHPGRLAPMVVQQYIDTGEHVSVYRVLSFFGEPLYAQDKIVRDRKISLTATDAEIEQAPITDHHTEDADRVLTIWPDALELAAKAHAVFPEIPLAGVDLVREAKTGKLYLLEMNSGGNTWLFSSARGVAVRALNGRDFEAQRRSQFDALRTAARVLVDKTKAEAS